MSRFESGLHVVSLFVVASLVSIGLILLINAEQNNRLHLHHHQIQPPPPTHFHQTQTYNENEHPTSSLNDPSSASQNDSKLIPRRVLEWMTSGIYSRFITLFNLTNISPQNHPRILEVEESTQKKTRIKRSNTGSKTLSNKLFSEDKMNLYSVDHYLTSRGGGGGGKTGSSGGGSFPNSDFHKIRHALKKLDTGGIEGDAILRMMLDSNGPFIQNEHSSSRSIPMAPPPPPPPPSLQQLKQEPTQIIYNHNSNENESYHHTSSTLAPPSQSPLPLQSNPNILISESSSRRGVLLSNMEVCYKTDDVLIVIAITCSLNFAFVLLIWASVRWFSPTNITKEKDFTTLECENGTGETLDEFWSTSGGGGSGGGGGGGGGGDGSIFHNNPHHHHHLLFHPSSSKSLNTFRHVVPEMIGSLRRSHSLSMEDVRHPLNY